LDTLLGRLGILEEIRQRFPDAKIVHWLGPYKLAGQLDREVQQLFLHGVTRVRARNQRSPAFLEKPGF